MMWMMGYNDGAELDPFTGRKLRPLVPRPAAASTASPAAASLTQIYGTDLFALNHQLAMAAEQNKRSELTNTQQVVVSSRWNPTPEQLQTLEELYRSGTRTPSADQIQHITAQLRKYGKIEGKNVFYWFQNHKARERQKRRRQQLESLSDEPQITHAANHHLTQNGERKELPPGPNKTAFEVEQTKNWASPTNSSTLAEKTVCTQGAAAAAGRGGEAECKAGAEDGGGGGGWAQLDIDGAELLQQRRNATWQMMHLSCSSSASPTNHNLIMASSSSASSTVTSPATTVIPSPIAAASNQHQQSHDQLHHFVNIFSKPFIPASASVSASAKAQMINLQDHCEEDSQTTLQLFPLESSRSLADDQDEEEDEDVLIAMDHHHHHHHHHHVAAPYQFFEFLPLKN